VKLRQKYGKNKYTAKVRQSYQKYGKCRIYVVLWHPWYLSDLMINALNKNSIFEYFIFFIEFLTYFTKFGIFFGANFIKKCNKKPKNQLF
jgi:hypothetical protein